MRESVGKLVDFKKKSTGSISRSSFPLFILFVLIIIFFNRMALSNLILARGDTFLYFYPYWSQASEALRNGRVPLWNPDLFMGVPFIANSQVGFFYPLNWPLWLLLPTPYAVSASILIHIFIAGSGVYLAGRKCLSLDAFPALIAGILFALGGYFTAQIEHINQLQGIAWLPWFLVFLCSWKPRQGDFVGTVKLTLAMVILISLQLLTGHMQTVFITLVGVAIWLCASVIFIPKSARSDFETQNQVLKETLFRLIFAFIPLVVGVLFALLLTSIQILPTLELTQYSSRQGGLPPNEALSFSLHPLLLSRSLLPTYDSLLFSEYEAVLPLTALILAIVGAWRWREWAGVLPTVVLAVSGLFLAFGVFNPIYQLLIHLPGFNWFRAPARWLVLYALGVALVAGVGLEQIVQKWRSEKFESEARHFRLPVFVGILILLGLMIWGFIAVPLAEFIPVGAEVSIVDLSKITWTAWLAELAAVVVVLTLVTRRYKFVNLRLIILVAILVGCLYLATRVLPYNSPTTPEAVYDLRPPISRLIAVTTCLSSVEECQLPGDRYLSLSDIFFDVGDQTEIDTVYQDQLSELAQYDYTIATKQKEIISPNLSMMFDLAAVDGFDGGLLPLKNYTELVTLILPVGTKTTDGRLREYLERVPEDRWLDLFNARYLVTDKVGDEWREGVFFDQQHSTSLTAENPPATVGYIPDYESTELWFIAQGQPGPIEVETMSGQRWILGAEQIGINLYRVTWPVPTSLQSIKFFPCSQESGGLPDCNWELWGLALVDSRDETFQTLVPGDYRLTHSGDVKIYENQDVLPRAFLVKKWSSRPSIESSIEAMRAPDFDPAQVAVILDSVEQNSGGNGHGRTMIETYEPERVTVRVEGDVESLLVLTDAHYPGWQATIDGESAPIYQTDVLFRGVIVPSGIHEVEFIYKPTTFKIGVIGSLIGLVVLLIMIVYLLVWPRFNSSNS